MEEAINYSLILELSLELAAYFCCFQQETDLASAGPSALVTDIKTSCLKSQWSPSAFFHRMVPPLPTSAEKSGASDVLRQGHPGAGAMLKVYAAEAPSEDGSPGFLTWALPLRSPQAAKILLFILEIEGNHARCDSPHLTVTA